MSTLRIVYGHDVNGVDWWMINPFDLTIGQHPDSHMAESGIDGYITFSCLTCGTQDFSEQGLFDCEGSGRCFQCALKHDLKHGTDSHVIPTLAQMHRWDERRVGRYELDEHDLYFYDMYHEYFTRSATV